MADLPNPHTPAPLLASTLRCSSSSGWVLARGANLQKFWFKRDPKAKAFGVLEPRAISGDGKHVLASGFWGLSRHINYLGEILMATGLTLASAIRSRSRRGSTRSITWRCCSRASTSTTSAAPRSTARSGTSTASACRAGSFPGSTDSRCGAESEAGRG